MPAGQLVLCRRLSIPTLARTRCTQICITKRNRNSSSCGSRHFRNTREANSKSNYPNHSLRGLRLGYIALCLRDLVNHSVTGSNPCTACREKQLTLYQVALLGEFGCFLFMRVGRGSPAGRRNTMGSFIFVITSFLIASTAAQLASGKLYFVECFLRFPKKWSKYTRKSVNKHLTKRNSASLGAGQ